MSVKWESLRRNVHGVSVVLSSLIAGMALVSIFIAFSYYYSLLFKNYLHYVSRISGVLNEPQMMLDIKSNSTGLFGVLNISYPGGKIKQVIVHYKPACNGNNIYMVEPELRQSGIYVASFPVCNSSAMLIQVVDSKNNIYFYRLDKDPLHRGPIKYWVSINDIIKENDLMNSIYSSDKFIACVILENVYDVDCDEYFNFTLANITVFYDFTRLANFVVDLISMEGASSGSVTIPYTLLFKVNGKNLEFSDTLNLVFNVTDWVLVKSFSKYYSSVGALRVYREYVKRVIVNNSQLLEIHKIYDYFQTMFGFNLRRKLVFIGGTVNLGNMSIAVVPLRADYMHRLSLGGSYYRQPGLFKIVISYRLPFTFLPISSEECNRIILKFDDSMINYGGFVRAYAGVEGSSFRILVLVAPPRVTTLTFYSRYLRLSSVLDGDLSILHYDLSNIRGYLSMVGYYSTRQLNTTLEQITFYVPINSANVCPGWVIIDQKMLSNYVRYGGTHITLSWYSNSVTFVSKLLKS